jgi:hypothetical protein
MTPVRILPKEIRHQQTRVQEKPPPPPPRFWYQYQQQTQHIFSTGIFTLKHCKSYREAILTEAWERSSRSDLVDVEGILWLPILLLLLHQSPYSSWERKPHRDRRYPCCCDDACENTSKRNTTPINKSARTPPPPPKDFDININNKPNIYSPQCPKTYKNVCVHSLRSMVVFW